MDPKEIKPWEEERYKPVPTRYLSGPTRWARMLRERDEYLNQPHGSCSCSLKGALFTILFPVALLAIVLLHQLLAGSLVAALVLLLLGRVTPRLDGYTFPSAWGTALAAMVLPAVTFVLFDLLIAAIAPESFLGQSTIRTVDWLGTSSRMVNASGDWEVDTTLGFFTLTDAVLAFALALPGVAIVAWWMRRFATRESRKPLSWLPALLVVMLLAVNGWVVLDRVGGFTVSML